MVDIRIEGPDDGTAVFEVNRAAFGQDDEARLVDALRGSPAFIPELSLVAVEDDRVIGHILFTRVKVGAVDALALAPMAVLPVYQRRGIGSALVERGLARARDLGHRVVIVVGHPEYYPRFGFVPAKPLGIRAPFDVPGEVFMALALSPGALAGVQGRVEYPPEFD